MFGFRKNSKANSVKNFYQEVAGLSDKETRPVGVCSINITDIVGSVGRAEELDANFRFKNQGWTDRHQRIEQRVRQGQPMDPIKVFKVQSDRQAEYYVVDGHHRVAVAKRSGFFSMNADVTEVVLH